MDRIYHGRNGQKNFKTILHFLKEMHTLNSSRDIYSKLYKNCLVIDCSNPFTQTSRTK